MQKLSQNINSQMLCVQLKIQEKYFHFQVSMIQQKIKDLFVAKEIINDPIAEIIQLQNA